MLVDAAIVQAAVHYDVGVLGQVGVEQRYALHPAFDAGAAAPGHPNPLPHAEPHIDGHFHFLSYWRGGGESNPEEACASNLFPEN